MEYEKKILSAEREANNLREQFQAQDARRTQLQDEVRGTKEFRKTDWNCNWGPDGGNTGIAFPFLWFYTRLFIIQQNVAFRSQMLFIGIWTLSLILSLRVMKRLECILCCVGVKWMNFLLNGLTLLDATGGFFPLAYRLQVCIKMREISSRFQMVPVLCSQKCMLMTWYSGYNSWGKHPVLSPGFPIKRQWDRAALWTSHAWCCLYWICT